MSIARQVIALTENEKDRFRVTVPEGVLTGSYSFTPDSDPFSSDPEVGEVQYIETREGSRRSGVATSLMKKAIVLLKKRGLKRVCMVGASREGRGFIRSLRKQGVLGRLVDPTEHVYEVPE